MDPCNLQYPEMPCRQREKKKQDLMYITGKDCRALQYAQIKQQKLREVPAFSYLSLQKNTVVTPPQKIDLFRKRSMKRTFFSIYFERGDIPAVLKGRTLNPRKPYSSFPVKWFCAPADLDYCYYLPIFVDGLADKNPDLHLLALYGAMDMIVKAPQKILPVLPKVILPLKRAFNTHNKAIIISALKVLQLMVLVGPCVGQALVPFYRQLLSVCNLYKNINVNLGCGIDPDRGRRIGDVIEDTLKLLEHCGGPNAFINIKYMIPTYESNSHPRCNIQDKANAQHGDIGAGHPNKESAPRGSPESSVKSKK